MSTEGRAASDTFVIDGKTVIFVTYYVECDPVLRAWLDDHLAEIRRVAKSGCEDDIHAVLLWALPIFVSAGCSIIPMQCAARSECESCEHDDAFYIVSDHDVDRLIFQLDYALDIASEAFA